MTTINETVLALSKKIEAQLELDDKSGVGSAKTDVYHDNLPEGLTKEVVTQVKDYDTTFVAAATYAAGKMAVAAMAGNQSLNTALTTLNMGGKDSLVVHTERSKVFENRLGGKNEEITKFGATTASLTVYAGKNGGQLKAARNAIVELAAAALQKA